MNPACPVAQKPHAIAHPTWLLTHTVTRSGYTISTVSTRPPSASSHRYFTVSPLSLTRRTTWVSEGGSSTARRSRNALGTLLMSTGAASCVYSPAHSWSSR